MLTLAPEIQALVPLFCSRLQPSMEKCTYFKHKQLSLVAGFLFSTINIQHSMLLHCLQEHIFFNHNLLSLFATNVSTTRLSDHLESRLVGKLHNVITNAFLDN